MEVPGVARQNGAVVRRGKISEINRRRQGRGAAPGTIGRLETQDLTDQAQVAAAAPWVRNEAGGQRREEQPVHGPVGQIDRIEPQAVACHVGLPADQQPRWLAR